jgi:hypothetical protein
MKKTIQLTHEKIKYPRMVDAAKNEVRKYIKRERRKELPEGVDYWDFDCKFGDTEADAKAIHLTEIDEVLRKEGVRIKSERERTEIPELPKLKGFGEE